MENLKTCQFCGYISNQENITNHEEMCFSNPNRKLCGSCNHEYLKCFLHTCDLLGDEKHASVMDAGKPCKSWTIYVSSELEKSINQVYDLLVTIGGAIERDRFSFIQAHAKEKPYCEEWRFQGHLGFGGKYRIRSNRVDCYREDETTKRLEIIEKLNTELSKIKLRLI